MFISVENWCCHSYLCGHQWPVTTRIKDLSEKRERLSQDSSWSLKLTGQLYREITVVTSKDEHADKTTTRFQWEKRDRDDNNRLWGRRYWLKDTKETIMRERNILFVWGSRLIISHFWDEARQPVCAKVCVSCNVSFCIKKKTYPRREGSMRWYKRWESFFTTNKTRPGTCLVS